MTNAALGNIDRWRSARIFSRVGESNADNFQIIFALEH